MTAYIVINVALKEPSKLISLAGLACFILLMVLLSNNKRKIQWHTVFWGIVLQFLLGLFILKSEAGRKIVMWFADRLQELIAYSNAASEFMFGPGYIEHMFAFKILPSIVFFTTVVTLLQYFGVIQAVVRTMGRFLAFVLGVSAPEAMNASANIFVGGGESAVIVLQYIDSVPVSHLFTFLTAGAASLGGAALIQFIGFGVPAEYLLAASVMSAPAALVCSKIMYPDTEEPYHVTDAEVDVKTDEPENRQEQRTRREPPRVPKGVVEAIVLGAQRGLKLIANIFGVLVVFLAFIDFADATIMWFGERVDVRGLTLRRILSYIFYPFSFLMGVDREDCLLVGEFLGIRTVALAPVAFLSLAQCMANGKQFEEYTAQYNSSWSYRGDGIFLEHWNVTLQGGMLSERSTLIATYALCGFASITTVGLSLGAIGSLAPRRLSDISKIAPWAVVSGTLASYLTACIAGVLS